MICYMFTTAYKAATENLAYLYWFWHLVGCA
jgi:hypothetical protein